MLLEKRKCNKQKIFLYTASEEGIFIVVGFSCFRIVILYCVRVAHELSGQWVIHRSIRR